MFNKNILIADDDKDFLVLYEELFKDFNSINKDRNEDVTVKTFDNGLKLLEYFHDEYKKGNKIPLCILDMRMPDIDGLETADLLRKIDNDVIIIIITAYSGKTSFEEIKEKLNEDIYYIKKPFSTKELYCLVDSLIKSWNKNLQIKESQERYKELANSLPQIIFETDLKGNLTFINSAANLVYGYTVENASKGLNIFELVSSEDRDRARDNMQKTMSGEGTNGNEYTIVGRDGTKFSAISHSRPIIYNGKTTGIRGIIVDITDRKKMEEILHYRLTIEELITTISTSFINITSTEVTREINLALESIGTFMDVDRSYVNIFSHDMERVKEVYEWCNKEIGSRVKQIKNMFMQNYLWTVEQLKNGQYICVSSLSELPPEAEKEKASWGKAEVKSILGIPLYFSNKLVGYFMLNSVKKEKKWKEEDIRLLKLVGEIFINALERKKSEEALTRSEANYRMLVENTRDIIYSYNPDGTVRFITPQVAKLGYNPEEIVGRKMIDFVHPDDKERILNEFKKFIVTGKSFPTVCRLIGKKSVIHIEEISEIIKDEKGDIAYITGVIRDITERIKSEEEKSKLEKQLRHSDKIKAIGTLAGGIAHDFNNILVAILGYIEVALYNIPNDSNLRPYMEQMKKACHRAIKLVKQLLTFSRETEGERNPIQLSTIIKESLKMLRPLIPATIDIKQNLKNPGIIHGDPTHIYQIMMNLCKNAADAMKEKGGVIKVSLKDIDTGSNTAELNQELAPGNYIRLTVSDTGHGIEQSIKERIFEPYFTTKKIGEGSGMGLSIVHGIVKSYGGEITVESETGKGTSFNIFFPKIKSNEHVEIKGTSKPPGGNENILLVDDEEDMVVRVLKKILEDLGYNVVAKYSGNQAFKVFCEVPEWFDLVITDQTMPKMTGLELSRRLLQVRPDIPIILTSGFSQVIPSEMIKKIGIKQFITKPFEIQELANIMRKLLDEQAKNI
ncbi:MAG: PAS domain S-box protein [Candidatus Eremiobacterota bacterium]